MVVMSVHRRMDSVGLKWTTVVPLAGFIWGRGVAHTDSGNDATEIGTTMKPTKHNPYPTIRGVYGEPFVPGATAQAVRERLGKFYDRVGAKSPASFPV